jgi:hypothetical protein
VRRRLYVNQDLVAGLMFVALGAFGMWLGRNYPMGSALRMGPGYVPMLLSSGLVALGAIIALRGALARGDALARWHPRPLIVITTAILAFAETIEAWGLVAASVAVVVLSSFGSRECRLIETLVLAAGLTVAAILVFVVGLKLTIPVWPV